MGPREDNNGVSEIVNVNVFLDGTRDQSMLRTFRDSCAGNTLEAVRLYDAPLEPKQRARMLERANETKEPVFWCERARPLPKGERT